MNINLSKVIRYHRIKSGLTLAELADMAGVGKNMVYEVEKGRLSIQLDNLMKILNILNLTIELKSPLMALFKRENPDENG
nr:helix-turn-helix transcriptional regulator [Desulfobacula sp.]